MPSGVRRRGAGRRTRSEDARPADATGLGWGAHGLVVAIDAKRSEEAARWEAYPHGGRTTSGRDAVAWAQEAEDRGAGEILLTSMDRDGTGIGFDCELTRVVADSVRIPVIASGGAGGAQDFV